MLKYYTLLVCHRTIFSTSEKVATKSALPLKIDLLKKNIWLVILPHQSTLEYLSNTHSITLIIRLSERSKKQELESLRFNLASKECPSLVHLTTPNVIKNVKKRLNQWGSSWRSRERRKGDNDFSNLNTDFVYSNLKLYWYN